MFTQEKQFSVFFFVFKLKIPHFSDDFRQLIGQIKMLAHYVTIEMNNQRENKHKTKHDKKNIHTQKGVPQHFVEIYLVIFG